MRPYKLKVKKLDIEAGLPVVSVNERWAKSNAIHTGDRLKLSKNKKNYIAIVNVSKDFIKDGEIGLYKEVWDKFRSGEIIDVYPVHKPESVNYIRKKLKGYELNEKEISSIINDLVKNKLSKIETTAFVISSYLLPMSMKEILYLTKAIINTGKIINFQNKIVVDKHCIGGVPGNRTTMIVVPIVAAAGLTIPKTSSRAITSPSGTADTMEVLAKVDLNINQIKSVVKKTNGCMVWGGSLGLAPADDKIINIEHPLKIDPEGQLIASILAKKKSVGSTHVLIDIPVGISAKITSYEKAKQLKEKFEEIAKELKMKLKVVITDGSQPIGNGIGPILEARDVLMVLQRHPDKPKDLEEKAIFLAGEILELAGLKKGKEKARKILEEGLAWKKMQEIIKAQKGNYKIKIEDLKPGLFSKKIISNKTGTIISIDNNIISKICRYAGAPVDKGAGVLIKKHVGEEVYKGDELFTIYSENEDKLERALNILKQNNPYKII